MDISSSASSLGVVKTGGGRERDVLFGASGCGRLSVGNTHGSCWGTRHSRWSQACRPWSVNPSRKLRRFESFTWHHVLERADQWKRLGGDPFIYLVGVSMLAWLSRSHGVRPQVCDLHKRGRADGRRRRLWEYVRKFGPTPRAGGLDPRLTTADAGCGVCNGGGLLHHRDWAAVVRVGFERNLPAARSFPWLGDPVKYAARLV
jgi:hypothetical protein